MAIYEKAQLGYADNLITFNDFTLDPIYRAVSRAPQKYQVREQDIPVPFESGVTDFNTLIGQTIYVIEGVMYPSSESSYDTGLAKLRDVSSLDLEQVDPYIGSTFSDDGYVPYLWGDSGGDYTKQLFVKPLYVQVAENTRQGYVLPFKIFCKVKDPTIYGGTLKTASTASGTPILQKTITNLITNPSLETGTTGWSKIGTGGSIAQDATQFYTRANSLKLTTASTGNQQAAFTLSGLSIGQTYTMQGRVRTSAAGKNTYLQTSIDNYGTFFQIVSSSSGWDLLSGTITAANTSGTVEFGVFSNSDFMNIDAVMVQTGTTLSTYFDGASTSNVSNTYAWTGTADASTSTNSVYQTGSSVYSFTYPVVYGATYYTVTATASNLGTVPVYPQSIDIYGPVTTPIITNNKTGEFIKVGVTLNSPTDHLQIQYGKDVLTVTLNGVNNMRYVSSDSTYFKIKPGGNNISLSGSTIASGAYATVTYYDGYSLA